MITVENIRVAIGFSEPSDAALRYGRAVSPGFTADALGAVARV
jgi:hypothetical protein